MKNKFSRLVAKIVCLLAACTLFASFSPSLDGRAVVADEGTFEIVPTAEQAKTLKNYVGKEVYFGIRPEDLAFQETPAATNNMQMKVSVIEPLGAETNLFVTTKTQSLTARCKPDYKYTIGETVNFVPAMEKSKFFDKDTELNICETPTTE